MGLLARFCLLTAVLSLPFAVIACSSRALAPLAPNAPAASRAHAASTSKTPKRLHPHATDTWTAGAGNWSVAGNWSAGTPVASSDVVINDNPSKVAAVTLDVPATVNSLTLSSGNSLTQSPNESMTIGGTAIVNSGAYNVVSALLAFNAPPVTLSGGGTVTLSGTNATIADGTSLNNVDNLIQGAGRVGNGTIALANSGTIEASGGTLTVQPTISGTTNTGAFEAGSGGTLVVYGATTQSGNGNITAQSGGIVQLHDLVKGGLVSSAGSGDVQVLGGNTNTLDNVTISGRYDVLSSGTSVLIHTITNNGTIRLDSKQGQSLMDVQGSVLLTGTGAVTMTVKANNPNNAIAPGVNGLLLDHNPISGAGSITTPIVNFSTIDANAKEQLVIAPGNTSTDTNHGTMEATSGGTLSLANGTIDNRSSKIVAAAGSRVLIGSTIRGGTLSSIGTGVFRGISGTLDGTIAPVTNDAAIVVLNANSLNVKGSLENFGTISVGAPPFTASLYMSGSLTLDGPGRVSLRKGLIVGQHTDTLVNRSTIEGSGILNGMRIHNEGTIAAIPAAPLQLIAAPTSTTVTSGSIVVPSKSKLTVSYKFAETAGTIAVDGTLQVDPTLRIAGGTLLGKGRILGSIDSSGLVVLGDSVSQPAIVEVAGSYTQRSSGELDASIGAVTPGTHYSRLAVANAAQLGGKLKITRIGNFIPAIGDTFTIITVRFHDIDGRFATVSGRAITPKERFEVIYKPKEVVLKVVKIPVIANQIPAYHS